MLKSTDFAHHYIFFFGQMKPRLACARMEHGEVKEKLMIQSIPQSVKHSFIHRGSVKEWASYSKPRFNCSYISLTKHKTEGRKTHKQVELKSIAFVDVQSLIAKDLHPSIKNNA